MIFMGATNAWRDRQNVVPPAESQTSPPSREALTQGEHVPLTDQVTWGGRSMRRSASYGKGT